MYMFVDNKITISFHFYIIHVETVVHFFICQIVISTFIFLPVSLFLLYTWHFISFLCWTPCHLIILYLYILFFSLMWLSCSFFSSLSSICSSFFSVLYPVSKLYRNLRKKRTTATNSNVLNQSMTKYFIRAFVPFSEHHQELFNSFLFLCSSRQ